MLCSSAFRPTGGRAGAYYAAREFATALRETAYHFARFAADSIDPPRYETMRVLVGKLDVRLHDVGSLSAVERVAVLNPSSYVVSQAFAQALRETRSNGVVYPSVRT